MTPTAPRHKHLGGALPVAAAADIKAAAAARLFPISNGVGVGILSYNRAACLRRLVASIIRTTNLARTTVFISDDGSDDQATITLLAELAADHRFVVLRNRQRVGVAGNSNRLLRCLSRFPTGLILNDDVEVLVPGWDTFYASAMRTTGLDHFCLQQQGLYGAPAATPLLYNGLKLTVVRDRPHGVVLAFTHSGFAKVGYFDDRFGMYGLEHVDWSARLAHECRQPVGFYDVAGSNSFFVAHQEPSACQNRTAHLAAARTLIAELAPGRGFVQSTVGADLAALTCVIPCRDSDRHGAIPVVVNNIRAQRFPVIELVVVEHDDQLRLNHDAIAPVTHLLAAAKHGAFCKSAAVNAGAAAATTPLLLIHDADILTQAEYVGAVHDVLSAHSACHLGRTVTYLTAAATAAVVAGADISDNLEFDRTIGYFEGGSLACRAQAYWWVGGFNEDFRGWGVEDCEFYERLSTCPTWLDDRRFDFLHLHHGRVAGWDNDHARNKQIDIDLKQISMGQRMLSLRAALKDAGYGRQVEMAINGA